MADRIKAERVRIEDATMKQIEAFAALDLGLEFDKRATRESLIERIRAAGHQMDDIRIVEETAPGPARQAQGDGKRPAPFGYDSEVIDMPDLEDVTYREEKRPQRRIKVKRDRMYYGIVIETNDGSGGEDPVAVGCNGKPVHIPRGIGVAVPVNILEVLENANMDVYAEQMDIGPGNPGGLRGKRQVQSYPFKWVGHSEVRKVVNHEDYRPDPNAEFPLDLRREAVPA